MKTKAAETDYEYRVAVLTAPTNIYKNTSYLHQAFLGKVAFVEERVAINYAELLDRLYQTEYGVCVLKNFQNKKWNELETKGV